MAEVINVYRDVVLYNSCDRQMNGDVKLEWIWFVYLIILNVMSVISEGVKER